MAEQVITFTSGMIKDVAKTLQSPNSYLDANNIRLITDKGQTNGSMINVKGNKYFIDIPNTTAVFKLQVSGTLTSLGTIITVNGTATVPITITSSSSGQNIYDVLSNIAGFNTTFNVAIADNYVIIYSQTVNVTVALSGTSSTDLTLTTTVPAQTNLEVISYGTIDETIVLFTTNDTSSVGGYGQIWKLTYNKQQLSDFTTTAGTIKLIYNGDVKFTKQHPFPQEGGTEGRYENVLLQKIYWTDNFNPLRVLNIENVNSMAVDPSILDVRPAFTMDVPILQKINDTGGVLKVGKYTATYRLKNTNGAETLFAPESNEVSIIPFNTTGLYRDIQGAAKGTNTNKTISWTINNLDTDYERVEIVICFWEDPNQSVPTIVKVIDEPIPASGIFPFTYTGEELTIDLSINEFVGFNNTFNRCKSIASKDNRLFAANLAFTQFNVTFDSRAVRFRADNRQATLTGTGGLTIDGTLPLVAQFAAVSSTADFIQLDQSTQNNTSYRFQSDGITLGGEGPNIKYTFEAFTFGGSLYGDVQSMVAAEAAVTAMGALSATNPYGLGFRFTNSQTGTITLNGNAYAENGEGPTFTSPYLESVLRSYQHEEIYRAAIVFYDLQGNASEAKWIADIKMPRIYENNPVGANFDFSITNLTTNTNQFFRLLHPIFTINLSNMSATDRAKIGGCSIVRLPRKQSDKTIEYAGCIYPTVGNAADGAYYLPELATNGGYSNIKNAHTPNVPSRSLVTMGAPDVLLNSFTGWKSGDKLILTSVLNIPAAGWKGLYATSSIYSEKDYIQTATTRAEIGILAAQYIGKNSTTNLTSPAYTPNLFHNRSPNNAGGFRSLGMNTLLLELDNYVDYDASGLVDNTTGKFYAFYKRTITNQYGGNTYSQRSENEYISCGHFQPITPVSTNVFTASIFGGDIYIDIFDYQKMYKNWSFAPVNATKESYLHWFPCQMQSNSDWRFGQTLNNTGVGDTGSASLDIGEVFSGDINNNPIYSAQLLSTKRFKPLPAVFLPITEYRTRVAFTPIKINGEFIDNWGVFKTDDYWDVEEIYGPISNLDVLRDQIIFFQDRAFGVLEVNPRALIQDATGTELQLGSGNVIQRHDYISTEAGAKHQWGMCKSNYNIYFFDIIMRRFFKYTPGKGVEPLSDLKGMQSWSSNTLIGEIYNNDNPVYGSTFRCGMNATFDFRFDQVIFSFFDILTTNGVKVNKEYTLTYSEQLGCFESFLDVHPSMWINDRINIFSRDPNNVKKLYCHNIGNYGSFYGFTYNSTLSTICNTSPTTTKSWDNISWHSEVKNSGINQAQSTLNELRCYTDNQNSDYIVLSPNINVRRMERTWNVTVPRNTVTYSGSTSPDIFDSANLLQAQLFKSRLRDKTITSDFVFYNTNNLELILHYVKYLFKASPR